MAQGYIQVAPDGSGKKVDTVVTATAGQHRNVIAIGDPSTDASVAPVDATLGLSTQTTRGAHGTPTETTPTVATATSTQLLAANTSRKYFLIQNETTANIMISLTGGTLSGIAPTSTNIGLVLKPGDSYESAEYCTTSAITCYQTSGASTNAIYVVEG